MKVAFLFLISILPIISFTQKITINGYISDAESRERLIGANIYEAETKIGTTTNEHGFYSLTMDHKTVQNLVFSYIGYQSDTLNLSAESDSLINVLLVPSVELNTIEFSANSEEIQRVTQMSTTDLQAKEIKQLPAILGEVDVIKALQLMPGIQAGNEGLSGLYVRGGSPDQNLVLLDGVPIYNPSHVLGIFSIFNADAIKNVSLLKGGFPARYGGRLSSVLNINLKDGNLNKIHGEGAISNVAAKFLLEGPIQKESTSFLISTRRSYIDLLFAPFLKSQSSELEQLSTFFYDLNAKIQHRINDKHSLYISGYTGKDALKTAYKDDETQDEYGGALTWQNQIATIRWNYNINSKIFANTTLSYTDYNINISDFFKQEVNDTEARSTYRSGIQDYALRSVVEIIPNTHHYLQIGGNAIQHTYRPGALTLIDTNLDEVLDTLLGAKSIQSFEYNFFIEDEWSISEYFSANMGLHYSGFQTTEQNYTSLQPRISLRYQVIPQLALKASFATMTQYINLLSSETLGLPSDLWVPSTDRIRPQQAWQLAGGIAGTLSRQFDFTLEGFYKNMDNVVSYTEGAQFVRNFGIDWQDNVVQGEGKVFGVEAFLKKKIGETTGWVGYTLSWNWRRFDEINGGERFPFRYDRRHDIALVVMHQQSKKVAYSFSWVYGTGNAITVPTARYATQPNYARSIGGLLSQQNATERFVIDEKNGFRMSATHRLDVSVSLYKEKEKFERKWIFSVYNLYSHVNPYYVIQDIEPVVTESGQTPRLVSVLKEIGILPIIPSVSYTFKF